VVVSAPWPRSPIPCSPWKGCRWRRSQDCSQDGARLRERHYDTAGNCSVRPLFTEFHGDLGADFEDLDEIAARHWCRSVITPRTYDYVPLSANGLEARSWPALLPPADAGCARGFASMSSDRQPRHSRSSQFEETNERLRRKFSLIEGERSGDGGFIGPIAPASPHHRARRIGLFRGYFWRPAQCRTHRNSGRTSMA